MTLLSTTKLLDAEVKGNLLQNFPGDAPVALRIPQELLAEIGRYVSTGNNHKEVATNALHFRLICAYTCKVSGNSMLDIKNAIENDRALVKSWPKIVAQIGDNSLLDLKNASDIRAWMEKNPATLQTPTELNLCDLELKVIPREIKLLTNLIKLELSGNLLQRLPDDLDQLTKLEELYLDFNQLTELPSTIGNLSNLTTLELTGNLLTILPEEIGNLKKLTTLTLAQNQLQELPKMIHSIPGLASLNLAYNPCGNLLGVDNTLGDGCLEEINPKSLPVTVREFIAPFKVLKYLYL